MTRERPSGPDVERREGPRTRRTDLRNPRAFDKPLAIGAPEPAREIPFKPSRMIHFLDLSNEKMVRKGAGHRTDGGHLARQPRGRGVGGPQGGGARRADQGGSRDGYGRDGAVDARQFARVAVGARRSDRNRGRDRGQDRGDHGPQGRGPLGHPLRGPTAGPAGGKGGHREADPRARDPRDGTGRGQPRGDRGRLARASRG